MIRINLLPQARRPTTTSAGGASAGSTVWAVIYLAAGVVWCIGLAAVYLVYDGDLDQQLQENQALEQRISTLEAKSEGLDKIQKQLERSKRLESLVDRLNEARTGPTRVLVELSNILSQGEGPSIEPSRLQKVRQENPLAGYNRDWDVRRLWLTSFEEQSRECRITGRGKNNEDVAEFLRRLSLSQLFEKVTLTKTQTVEDDESGLTFIGFQLTCKVRY